MKTNKLRFEVFKRDAFTCQYCGRRAPHVELNLEHIHPVSRGGTSDMWNLITACKDCNSGKSASPLTLEQVRRIDSHVPNLIAQLMAHVTIGNNNAAERLFEISRGGRLFHDWLGDVERLLDALDFESWQKEPSEDTPT